MNGAAAHLADAIAHHISRTSLELHSALARVDHHRDPAIHIRKAMALLVRPTMAWFVMFFASGRRSPAVVLVKVADPERDRDQRRAA